MKKRRFISVAVALAIIVSATASLTACTSSQTVNSTTNQLPVDSVSQQESLNSISLEKAIEIAVSDAGIVRENAKFKETSTDSNDTLPHYDIEFVSDGKEYDYEISVKDGKIISKSSEALSTVPESNSNPASVNSKPTEAKKDSTSYIGVDEAKNVALKDAGISADIAVFEKAEFDSDDIIPHYDIEFIADGFEFDYEIKAADGVIIEKDKEPEFSKKNNINSTEKSNDYIGENAAKEKALLHAKLSADSIKNFSIKLDRDDTIAHYEIEFISGKFEYEYEINAKNGNIIANDKEIID